MLTEEKTSTNSSAMQQQKYYKMHVLRLT